MSPHRNPYQAYSQNSIHIESSQKSIALLYEGTLRYLGNAVRDIENLDYQSRTNNINKATSIFIELINILDYDNGGEVAHYLSGLYTHQIKLLSNANFDNDIKKISTVMNVTKGLLEAWKEIHEEVRS